jgi:MoxR-like ATPase
MRLQKAVTIAKNMILSDKQFDAVILEGNSGVGKTSALYANVIAATEELVALENKVPAIDAAFRKKYREEIENRIIVVNMGGSEDATRFLGMPVPVDYKLHMLRPEEFMALEINDNRRRTLILDEVNRVETMVSNAVQPYLGSSDRKLKGLHNVVVFGTQNPAEDRFLGTNIQDEAFHMRTITFHIDDPTMVDLV